MANRAQHSEQLSPKENYVLAALPTADFERLQGSMKLTALPLGAVLYESGSQMSDCYFPVSGLVSLLYTLEDGGTAEIAVVGAVLAHRRYDDAIGQRDAAKGQRRE